MGTYYQGLTQDERQLLNNIFEELRTDHNLITVPELPEKAHYEVITGTIETIKRDLEIKEGKTVLLNTLP